MTRQAMSNLYIRIINGVAASWANFEARNEKPHMVYTPTAAELAEFGEPDFTIYNAGPFPADPYRCGMGQHGVPCSGMELLEPRDRRADTPPPSRRLKSRLQGGHLLKNILGESRPLDGQSHHRQVPGFRPFPPGLLHQVPHGGRVHGPRQYPARGRMVPQQQVQEPFQCIRHSPTCQICHLRT